MIKYIYLITFILNLSNFSAIRPLTPSEDYTHFVIIDELDPSQGVLFWQRVGTNRIQFEFHCKSTGWIGFGISPDGSMSGADIAISWVEDSTGKPHLKDTYTTGFTSPQIDPIQDWFLIDAAQVDGYTMIKMTRKLDTCDRDHDLAILEETNYLIFAWNDVDPKGGKNDWKYHGKNRIKSAQYLLMYSFYTIQGKESFLAKKFYDIVFPEV